MNLKKVDDLYKATLEYQEGLEAEIDNADNHNRFKVLQKHIRFQILNALVERYADFGADLKLFVLYNHHCEDQLSQRDITEKLKELLKGLSNEQKKELIHEAIRQIRDMLFESEIKDCRTKIDLILREKNDIFDRALGEDFEKMFLRSLKTFNQKTIANFIASFNLQMRGENEKGDGKACKKKLSARRTRLNEKMWADPKSRAAMCQAMKESWEKRKNGEGKEK